MSMAHWIYSYGRSRIGARTEPSLDSSAMQGLRAALVLICAILLFDANLSPLLQLTEPAGTQSFGPARNSGGQIAYRDRETADRKLREEYYRERILEMVRAHRRTASEAWRQRLAEAIYQESRAANVDPIMVASIVAKESSFRSRIVSRSGAVGLMQLRPFVAKDLAARSELEWHGRQTLNSPDLNLRLGIQYYKELVHRFDGDQRMALTAYNYGPTRVSKQLRDGTYVGSRYADMILDLRAEWIVRRSRT